jgi:hypothetical protein
MAETAGLNAFRQLVLAALRKTTPRIGAAHEGIDATFYIATPEGGFRITMTLSSDLEERASQMRLISRFLAWKLSRGFIMTAELNDPPVVLAVGISYRECAVAFVTVDRNTSRFSQPQWLSEDEMDGEIEALLPSVVPPLDPEMIEELREWFGPGGRFPAVPMS